MNIKLLTSRRLALHLVIPVLLLLIVACGKGRPAPQRVAKQPAGAQRTAEGPPTDWPIFMHDMSYLGISPDKTLRPPLELVWKFKTGGPVNSSPVVANGTVYVGSDDGRIYALHSRKWGVKWEFEAGDRIIYAPTFYDDTVYFSARDNKVYALNAASGAKKWEFQADGWINAPVVAFQKKVYFGCYDDKIYVLNASTGKEESQKRSTIEIGKIRYICSHGEFYPMDARYRADLWRRGLPPSESWPATANNVVYIGARDGKLRAFDSATRKEIWHFQTDGWVDSSPAIADGILYVGSRDGYVYALGHPERGSRVQGFKGSRIPGSLEPLNLEPLNLGEEGVATDDRVKVYSRLDNMAEIIAQVNEGEQLAVKGRVFDRRRGNWYEVILPDGRTGWMNASDFIAIRWAEDLQVNSPMVKDVKQVSFPKKAEAPSWSPDSSTIAFFDDVSAQGVYWRARSVWLAYGDGSHPRWVADGAFFNLRVSWSGNSSWVALENLATTGRQVWMFRSNGTGLRKVTEGESPAISPRGNKVAFIRRNRSATTIWVSRLEDGVEEKLAEIPMRGEESYVVYGYVAGLNLPAWSPDGSRLAVGIDGYHYPDNYSRVAVVSAFGGVMKEIAVRAARIRDVMWSPDGSYLAFVTQEHSSRSVAEQLDKQVHLVEVTGSGKRMVFEHCEGIAWSPDGKYLAFIEENDCMGMSRKIWLLNVSFSGTLRRIQLLASRHNIYNVFWLPDGKVALLSLPEPSKTAPRTNGWIVSIVPLPG